jgi:hypothetical protein
VDAARGGSQPEGVAGEGAGSRGLMRANRSEPIQRRGGCSLLRELASTEPDRVSEVWGRPLGGLRTRRQAYPRSGELRRQAGVPLKSLVTVKTPKGEYIAARSSRRKTRGGSARRDLPGSSRASTSSHDVLDLARRRSLHSTHPLAGRAARRQGCEGHDRWCGVGPLHSGHRLLAPPRWQ